MILIGRRGEVPVPSFPTDAEKNGAVGDGFVLLHNLEVMRDIAQETLSSQTATEPETTSPWRFLWLDRDKNVELAR